MFLIKKINTAFHQSKTRQRIARLVDIQSFESGSLCTLFILSWRSILLIVHYCCHRRYSKTKKQRHIMSYYSQFTIILDTREKPVNDGVFITISTLLCDFLKTDQQINFLNMNQLKPFLQLNHSAFSITYNLSSASFEYLGISTFGR